MDRKTRLGPVNSKIDVEQDNHDNQRQQHCLTCVNHIKKAIICNDIKKATWIGKKPIDHIIFNIPGNRIPHSGALACTKIIDHDAPL